MSFGQGGPSWGPAGPGNSGTPDWEALAEASESRARRKKWLLIGGGALATAAVAAIVATAVISANSNHSDDAAGKDASELPSASALPSETTAPEPSFSSVAPPPPPDPKDYISDAKKDRLPISVDAFFPGKTLTTGDRVHTKGATHSTTQCATTTQGALGSILTANGCDRVIRATYSLDGVAVTVGIAVFETEAQAKKTAQQASGGLASLSGSGVPVFCRDGAICRRTANSYGRYAYFTVGGFTNGKNVTKADKNVFAVGDDLTNFTFRQIRHRGEVQASAAADITTT
ncbi:hypothetical protein P8A18_20905 [Streptomyces castrisilvae]|uniref:Tat pathway signal sequence domain protein n=1 Tax=Streptomyces castrisilvae TaxID=3033811 RepID=A0ABY9HNW1_9ACTN|nr:hypothetical protein [Streptomyces sp. Mut1]WLQ35727.1 hypothetical protein P8A18_20905 [Streptomyces sp. Mut1]